MQQFLHKKKRPLHACPFKTLDPNDKTCTKEGGVCSLRLYRTEGKGDQVSDAAEHLGPLVTTCPYRFQEAGTVFGWVGEILLGHKQPAIVGEVGLLERTVGSGDEDVGRIDSVLVHPRLESLQWCALEIQAVYFSGTKMGREFAVLRNPKSLGVPFPVGHRRPDFRSSGPKRLMPQLQIKVPTLRRWGKKMAVLVDRSFFDSLGEMDDVKDVSNCDIAWSVVKYENRSGRATLAPDFVRLTTLERAVEGLTGGVPVSLEVFEARIREKVAGRPGHGEAS